MMKKFLLLFSLFLFTSGFVLAQQTVSGKITDENGDAIVGAGIVLKGTTKSTISDLDGNYVIDVPNDNAVLVFKFLGMETVEKKVRGGNR